jgi:hypothetical protein
MAQIVINSNKAVSFDNRLLYPRIEPYRITDNYNNYKRAIQHEKDGLITIVERFNEYTIDGKLPNNSGNQFIDINQYEIENGNSYQISVVFTLLVGVSAMYQVKTGEKIVFAKPAHYVTSTPNITMNLLENPIIENEGTLEISSYNRNRNSTNIATTKIYASPLGVSGGINVDSTYLNGGSVTTIGTNYDSKEEMIFKINSNYVGVISNIGSVDSIIGVKFIWYEK